MVPFLQRTNLYWHIMITQTPYFTLLFTLGGEHSMGLDKSILTYIHFYIIQSICTILKILCGLSPYFLSLTPAPSNYGSFFLFSRIHSMWKFLGQGLNLHKSSSLGHNNDNARILSSLSHQGTPHWSFYCLYSFAFSRMSYTLWHILYVIYTLWHTHVILYVIHICICHIHTLWHLYICHILYDILEKAKL